MSALRLNRNLIKRLPEFRYLSTALPSHEDEYTTSPQYPEILDLSHEKVLERRKEAEYEELRAVKTVEEKQIKLNMPRYYGFKAAMLLEDYIPYNSLPLVQHVTRTHLIKSENLPAFYNDIDVTSVVNDIKGDIEEVILVELERLKRKNELREKKLKKDEADNEQSVAISKQINRIILNHMSRSKSHLKDVHVDLNSRIESFWFVGGILPPENIRKCRRGIEWQKDTVDDPVDRGMNYIGSANVALRTDLPLKPIISASEAENPDFTVPSYKYNPATVGAAYQHRHIANIPGFWPGDPKEFGILSYHRRGHHLTRHYNDPEDNKDALYRSGILSSFAWLNAQANFQGFTTFNDLTYPLVTQTVITNGQTWSFFVYQLNTLINHSKYYYENPQRNVCWATPELKLFEGVESNKLVGFNDEVLKTLLKFYANTPEERLGVNLKPFLSKEEKVCADYKDDDKRAWLEREYKNLTSNRPRHIMEFEYYAWEKIYKIDHETRFMDKKRRPYEFNIKPWKRRLDERVPRYIPRVLRPELPRSKGRREKEFFP